MKKSEYILLCDEIISLSATYLYLMFADFRLYFFYIGPINGIELSVRPRYLILLVSPPPKCPAHTPLTSLTANLSAGHPLKMGQCPALTSARILSHAGECRTLWREQNNSEQVLFSPLGLLYFKASL